MQMTEKQSSFQTPVQSGTWSLALVTQAKDSLFNNVPNGLGACGWLASAQAAFAPSQSALYCRLKCKL